MDQGCHFNKDFIKNYNEESNEAYFFKVGVQYLKKLHEIHNEFTIFAKNYKDWKSKKACS